MLITFNTHPSLIAYFTARDTNLRLAHAVAEAIRLAPTLSPTDILLVNLSGRGDKDMGILARELHLNRASPTHAEDRGTR